MSRKNEVTIAVQPGPAKQYGDRVDQVRNGNRWRIMALDPDTNRIAAERVSDNARVVFDNDYVKSHVTLGYAVTVHSAQGVTADSCYAILGEGASRAMLYVAMTRGRRNNEAFLYQRFTNESDHEHSKPLSGDGAHIAARRGNKYSATQHFRMILAKDDRPRTMHAEAARTERQLLPEVVSDLLQRQDARRRSRRAVWTAHLRAAERWHVMHSRLAATAAVRAANTVLDTPALEM